jgi:hypothetical protein
VIHVPDRDLGETDAEVSSNGDGAVPKKRTRRGSRGGRGRKRKQAAGVAAATDSDEATSEERQRNGSGDWEYTPMSEWGTLDGRD